jgi:putative SOS response-associated peptidase YedK
VPVTGFFEWRHIGKAKYPYFIHLKDQKLFSLGAIYSHWVDRSTGEEISSYAILTTRANSAMEKIHNSKKRMPVIIPRDKEKEWLKAGLGKEEVLKLCEPIDSSFMEAHTISRMITSREVMDKNVPAISGKFDYPELSLIDS